MRKMPFVVFCNAHLWNVIIPVGRTSVFNSEKLDKLFSCSALLYTLVFLLSCLELTFLIKIALEKTWKKTLALNFLAKLLKSDYFVIILNFSNTFDTIYMDYQSKADTIFLCFCYCIIMLFLTEASIHLKKHSAEA